MRTIRLALAASVLAIGAFACKKTQCMDPARDSDVEARKEEVDALAKVIAKDPQFCRELIAPRVTLEADKLMLHGVERHEVGRRSELPLDDLRRIDPLRERLRAYRMLWKTLHPSRDFPGNAEVVLDPDLEIARALSVTHTLAASGYARQRVVAADVTTNVVWWTPSPPDGGSPTHHILDVKLVEDGVTMMRMRRMGCVTTSWEKVFNRAEGIAKVITRLCAGAEHCPRSIEVRAPKEYRFRQAMRVVHELVSAMSRYKHDPDDEEIALLLAGSNPTVFSPASSAPEIESSAYCLPDGGTAGSIPPGWMPPPR